MSCPGSHSIVAVVVVALRATTVFAEPAIERVAIVGNRRVEPDAIRVHISSRPGQLVDPARLRADVHAIWKLGLFDDVGS